MCAVVQLCKKIPGWTHHREQAGEQVSGAHQSGNSYEVILNVTIAKWNAKLWEN